MTMKEESKRPYVFLQERTERCNTWLEMVCFLIVVGFSLLCAAYSTHGFWSGFLDAIKQF